MLSFWNQRYQEPGYAYGSEPNDFLKTQSHYLPKGKVLCLAEGEGRNAVYLAQQGYEVTAIDQSEAGLQKAQTLAAEKGVTIETLVADLSDYQIQPDAWNGIVSISAHLPPALRKKVHRQVVDGLASGGVLILEAYTPKHIELDGIGGPPKDQIDMFMTLEGLQSELSGLTFELGQEIEREVNEGKYHQGRGAVVEVIAVKP